MKNLLFITALIFSSIVSGQKAKNEIKTVLKPLTTTQKVSPSKAKESVVKEKIASREKFLIADGWVKVDEKFNVGPVKVDVKFKPDYKYTIVAAMKVSDGSRGELILYSGNNRLTDNSQFIRENSVLLEINDFQPQPYLTEAKIALGLEQYSVKEGGVVIFKKIKDFKRDFYTLLEDRENGFKNVTGLPFRKNGEVVIYSGIIGLGANQSEVKNTETIDNYSIDFDMTKPKALEFVSNLMPLLMELTEKGYEMEEFKNKIGNDVTMIKKDGAQIMSLSIINSLNILSFSIYKAK